MRKIRHLEPYGFNEQPQFDGLVNTVKANIENIKEKNEEQDKKDEAQDKKDEEQDENIKQAIDKSVVSLELLSTPTEGSNRTYAVKQGGNEIGKIEIPFSSLVKSTTYDAENNLLIFTVDNDKEIKVNLTDLIEDADLVQRRIFDDFKNEVNSFSSNTTDSISELVQKLGSGFTGANTVTSVIERNEKVVSASLNDLNDRKLDASAYTPTDLSDYYKKEETSGKTDLDTAFNSKANKTDLDTHISDKIKHITADERTKWDNATDTLATHTGDSAIHITANERTKWNNADANSHTHENKAILDTITAIDSELNENSNNLVVNSAITKVIVENEKVVSAALNDLNDRKLDSSAYTKTDLSDYYKKEETSGKTELDAALAKKANASDLATKANTTDLTAHTGNSSIHITSDERAKWNGKISNAQYSKTDKKIYFYSGATTETPISSIDATDFIKDGMVSNVEIKDVTNSGSCLVITFNADSGKQDITIPVTKIFNPANYYLKSETSGKTEIATALDSKANTSELTKYYKKEETSGKTELNTAFGLKANASDLATKANTSDLTAHTGNSSIHITSDERTKWDGAATTLASHTGDSTIHITADERTKWNNAATSSHTHANKAVLDTITAIDTELSETSSNLVVNSAITKVIVANEKITSSSLNDLNDRKLDASAYTPTDLSDYYKKEETSGKTDIDKALASKANASDLTTHISDNIKHITSDERTKWNNAKAALDTHTGDSTVHITADERAKWNGKISSAQYSSADKKIFFYSGATTESPVANIDATDFIKDGMVSNVEIKNVTNSGSCLVITFNADSGKQDINIPVSTIFNPENYYQKTEIDASLAAKADTSALTAHNGNNDIHITADERTKWNNAIHAHDNKAVLDKITAIDTELSKTSGNLVVNSAITKVILENEKIVSTSLNDLNDRKLDSSAYTPTDLSDYYKKEETSGKTELDAALAKKANTSDLASKANTGHTHTSNDITDIVTAITDSNSGSTSVPTVNAVMQELNSKISQLNTLITNYESRIAALESKNSNNASQS